MIYFLRFFFYGIIIALILLFSIITGIALYVMHHKVIDFSVLAHYDPGRPSIVLDERGIEWARFQLDIRDPISMQKMPQHLINAFVAAEDWHFFKHHGISWKGILRSILVNVYHGKKVQGASTITQQLVKLLFLDLEKTFSRKIKEQLYALLVEQQFSKEQILQTYLNHVYFGCGIYGVQAASKRFWNKDVSDLTIDQAATLGGIVRLPSYYCPLVYPLSAQKRRDSVLSKMKYLGFITENEYMTAVSNDITVEKNIQLCCAPYVKEYIRQLLEQRVGKQQLYSGGLVIKTTLSIDIQKSAEKILKKQITILRGNISDVDGGLISIDRKTGAIKALIGGYDFASSKFNRALQARRQMGSTFKPILYAAAVQSGKQFSDTKVDEPFFLEQNGKLWQPKNYNGKFVGEVTLAYALSHSNNIASIKTFLDVGSETIIMLAKKSGLSGPLYPYPSLALGCVDATLKEVAGMFNVFANNGMYVEPHIISWVKNQLGNKIIKVNIKKSHVMRPRISGQVSKVLSIGIERYQAMLGKTKDEWLQHEVICKTGTTNDSRTCWFTGSTPELTTAVYIGCDDNREMGKNVYPLRTAFPIWLELNKKIVCSKKHFSYDPSLRPLFIDEKTGEIVVSGSKKGIIEILI
ncbi:PBP1A family penicillin-binding protein [Candidatus Dependentiae bacterium]|nr:PBP1A family penicillin-binding protein [Candidatus Dependentiae bacterium]